MDQGGMERLTWNGHLQGLSSRLQPQQLALSS